MHKIVNAMTAISAGIVTGLIVVIGLVIVIFGMVEWALKRFGLIALIAAVLAISAQAQGIVTGTETTITYSGTNATIVPPNTPATNFNSPNGTNVFLIPIPNPSVSIRFYITNNTVNACSNAFTAQLWAVSDAQTSTFNNSLANWQVIPLQDSGGNLVQTLLPSVPASGVAYFSSTAISAPRAALQFVNTTGGCATTNIEITAVITQITLTVPLVSTNSPTGFNGSAASQVQGVVTQEQNGTFINPILTGGLQLPINGALLTAGIDNWNSNFLGLPTGASGLFTINSSPAPAKANELALSIDAGTSDNVNANIVSPWVCAAGNSCQSSGGALSASTMKNPKLGTAFQKTYTNVTSTGQDLDAIVLFSSPTATLRQSITTSGPVGTATFLSGSAIIVSAVCAFTHCVFPPPTDTQGNNFVLLTTQDFSNGLRSSSLWVWASTTLSTIGADTVTFAASTGAISTNLVIEITGISPASLTQLAVTQESDPTGAQVIRLDAQFPNQFVCNVTLSTNTTTQCQAAPTVIGAGGLSVPVRYYVTDIQVQTTTAGTTSSIALKTGTGSNCATGTTNLSAIGYADTVAGISQAIGFRTPLIAPLQSAICATQTGGVAGTAVIEIHGFAAP